MKISGGIIVGLIGFILTLIFASCKAHSSHYVEDTEYNTRRHHHYHARRKPAQGRSISFSEVQPVFPQESLVQEVPIVSSRTVTVPASDLQCYVCKEDEEAECGQEPTPQKFVKSCQSVLGQQVSGSFLCLKQYDPYTKKISRSCESTKTRPEWQGKSNCTIGRHIDPVGKLGSRCICNETECNEGLLYIPENSKTMVKACFSNVFFLAFPMLYAYSMGWM